MENIQDMKQALKQQQQHGEEEEDHDFVMLKEIQASASITKASTTTATAAWMPKDEEPNISKKIDLAPKQHTRFFGRSPETETTSESKPDPSHQIAPCPETDTPFPFSRYESIVGNTPLVDISGLLSSAQRAKGVRVLAKCEFFNPSFSIKDRIVSNIFDKAERDGRLRPGMTVVAASSGNTGAATAMLASCRGYKCIITTSPKCSQEKMDAIRAYGAVLLVSKPGAKEGTPDDYMEMARLMCLRDPTKFFDVDQYDNLENPEGHEKTLGPEIFEQTAGKVTHFVAAGSTGGTVSGTSRFLKSVKPSIEVVLADPIGSIFTEYFNTGKVPKEAGKFLVEGVGKATIPGTMDFSLINKVVQVSDQQAFDMCKELCQNEGIFAGGSSGLNVYAAVQVAESVEKGPATIVTVLPDMGVKYLSKVYCGEWLEKNGISVQGDASSASASSASSASGMTRSLTPKNGMTASIPKNLITPKLPRYHDLVGKTPIIDLSHLVQTGVEGVQVLAKCEFLNPTFSIKDRMARNILDKAERTGRLRKGMTIVAASSGNTGAAIAMLASCRGYECIITTSPKCSKEKMDTIRAYGAELLVSPAKAKEGDPDHYMEMARLMCLKDPSRFFDVDQYETLDNSNAYYETLGPEIWEDTNRSITHFVAAGSTGGTITGTSRYLKEKNPEIRSVLADPIGSIFLEYFQKGKVENPPGNYLVEGVGKGSIPGAMDFSIIDEVVPVSDKDAFDMCAKLCKEGICAGGSSGLNVVAALRYARTMKMPCTIVTVMPDLGVKYLSKVYSPEWLKQNNLGSCQLCVGSSTV